MATTRQTGHKTTGQMSSGLRKPFTNKIGTLRGKIKIKGDIFSTGVTWEAALPARNRKTKTSRRIPRADSN